MADKKVLSALPDHFAGRRPARHPSVRDGSFALWLLLISWQRLLTMAAAVIVLLVVLFALAYLSCGGVTARPGSLRDTILFSMQVFARANLGFQLPAAGPAQLLVICELIVGWLFFIVLLALAAARFLRFRVFELYRVSLPEQQESGERAPAVVRREGTSPLSN